MTARTDRATTRLRRDIGIFGASFLALNAMIGAGIFALPGKIAVNAGLLSPWLFLVVGALFITIVLTFAELSSYYDQTGGALKLAQGQRIVPTTSTSLGRLKAGFRRPK